MKIRLTARDTHTKNNEYHELPVRSRIATLAKEALPHIIASSNPVSYEPFPSPGRGSLPYLGTPREAQCPDAFVKVHDIIRPRRLTSPYHHALRINSPRPSALPLISHHQPGAFRVGRPRPPRAIVDPTAGEPFPLYRLGDLVAEPAFLLPALDLGGGVEDGPEGGGAEPPGGVEGEVLVVDDGDIPGAADEVEPLLGSGG